MKSNSIYFNTDDGGIWISGISDISGISGIDINTDLVFEMVKECYKRMI
jgi:hypothetical protein